MLKDMDPNVVIEEYEVRMAVRADLFARVWLGENSRLRNLWAIEA